MIFAGIRSLRFNIVFLLAVYLYLFSPVFAQDVPDNDVMPALWEQAFGLNPYDAADAHADADNDGISNRDEYFLGSNPHVADNGRLPGYTIYWDGIFNNDWDDLSPNPAWQLHVNASVADQALIAADLKSVAVPPQSGQFSLAMVPERWRYLNLQHTNIKLDAWQSLVFYVHGGDSGGQQLQVRLRGSSLLGRPEMTLLNVDDYIEGGAVAVGAWRKVVVPLADLLDATQTVSQINLGWITGNTAPALYHLDNIHLLADPEPAPPLQIEVDAAAVSGALPSTLFGVNGATWMTNIHADPVVERVKALGSGPIRFPGGSTSDIFHWQETNATAPDWQTTPDEFWQLLQKSGNSGIITTNFGSGDAQEAAAWAQNALDQQADILLWEVGNEVYGSWENSWTHDGSAYMQGDNTRDGANDFCTSIKAVNPQAKVSMTGTIMAGEYSHFSEKALAAADTCFDYYSLHYYAMAPGRVDYSGLLSAANSDLPLIGENIRGMLAGRELELALTEYNSYYTEPEITAVQTVNMLFMAEVIGQAAEQGVSIANAWSLGVTPDSPPNTRYGLLQKYLELERTPAYFVYPLWSKSGDLRIAATANRIASRELSVYASKHSDSGDVTLLVINKSGIDQNGTISLQNFSSAGTADIYTVQGDSLDAAQVRYNGLAEPPVDLSQVAPVQVSTSGNQLSHSFPPYSVSSLTLPAAKPVRLSISMALQGAFNGTSMLATLAEKRLLPMQEPFSQWAVYSHHSANEQLNIELLQPTGEQALVDWVLLELRDANDPARTLDSKAALLRVDGQVVDAATGDPQLSFIQPAGSYFVAVRHHQHLGVMTREPQVLSGTAVNIAFNDPQTAIWGDHARVEINNQALLRTGDVNHDGRIVAQGPGNDANAVQATVLLDKDNLLFNNNFIALGYSSSDLSMDGKSIVSGVGNDLNLLITNVLLHPQNTGLNQNFVINEQLP
ncbi:MAG: hypothetical protein R3F02_21260 [Thiolinea sp.]